MEKLASPFGPAEEIVTDAVCGLSSSDLLSETVK